MAGNGVKGRTGERKVPIGKSQQIWVTGKRGESKEEK